MDCAAEQDWEVVHRVSWRTFLLLEPTALVARRRGPDGRWVYREPTPAEITDFLSREAW